MKWLIIPILILLNGCAYTVASTASLAVTGKSISDHAASTLTQNDCNSISYVRGETDYLCERAREPGTTYNRTAF